MMEIPKAQPKQSFDSFAEFKKLNHAHRALVVLAIVFFVGLSLPFIPRLIRKLRKIELTEKSKQAEAANKADKLADRAGIKPENPKEDLESDEDLSFGQLFDDEIPIEFLSENEDVPPELLVEQSLEKERQKLIQDFTKDFSIIDKIIAEVMDKNGKITREDADKVLEQYKKQKKLAVTDEQHSLLYNEIIKIIRIKNDPVRFPAKLTESTELIKFDTIGDGSCAFHALVGKPDDNGFYRCDAAEARATFCKYLQEAYDKGCLSEQIYIRWDDYFNVEMPTALKKALTIVQKNKKSKRKKTINLYDNYKKDLSTLSNKEKDERYEKLIKDPRVFKGYLNYLKNTSVDLYLEELFVAAECFDKQLNLFFYQNGLQKAEHNPSGKELISIYHIDGECKHYSRAEIREIKPAKA